MAFPFDVPNILPPSNDAGWLIRAHLDWLTFNAFLGVVPWLLAHLLFRPERRTTAAWWLGVAVFLTWMPNLVYLLTDVIHLPEVIGASPSPVLATAVFVPVFTTFLAASFIGYVDVVRRASTHLAGLARRRRGRDVALAFISSPAWASWSVASRASSPGSCSATRSTSSPPRSRRWPPPIGSAWPSRWPPPST